MEGEKYAPEKTFVKDGQNTSVVVTLFVFNSVRKLIVQFVAIITLI